MVKIEAQLVGRQPSFNFKLIVASVTGTGDGFIRDVGADNRDAVFADVVAEKLFKGDGNTVDFLAERAGRTPDLDCGRQAGPGCAFVDQVGKDFVLE